MPQEDVVYLDKDPGEDGEGEYQDSPICPRCRRPYLVREFSRNGQMLTCVAEGCGARFWLDA